MMMMMITMNGLAGCSVLMLIMCCFFDVHSVDGLSASSSLVSSSFKLHRRNASTLDELRSHDRLRHARHLASSAQSYTLYNGRGLYYAKLQIGTPPATYYAQVDTGSDLLWLNCGSCTASCTTSMSSLGVPLALYDRASSSSSSSVDCGDAFCSHVEGTKCSASGGQACPYAFQYGTGTSKGYIVRDVLQLDLVAGNQPASATIAFGCATTPDPALQELDGILGLGPSPTSITSQLMNQNEAPTVFAHCLQGFSDNGGGTLVIGNVQAPGLIYTPIIQPSSEHYNVNLLSIGVNGKTIPVDSSVSSSDPDKGTIIDSGTTVAFFEDSVYHKLLAAIFGAEGVNCTQSTGSLNDGFPDVTLTFEGSGSIMVIKPDEYLFPTTQENEYCAGFQSASVLNIETTILGDLVLVNKLIVYDLGQNQIGWVDYDCSSDVTIES